MCKPIITMRPIISCTIFFFSHSSISVCVFCVCICVQFDHVVFDWLKFKMIRNKLIRIKFNIWNNFAGNKNTNSAPKAEKMNSKMKSVVSFHDSLLWYHQHCADREREREEEFIFIYIMNQSHDQYAQCYVIIARKHFEIRGFLFHFHIAYEVHLNCIRFKTKIAPNQLINTFKANVNYDWE